jgi:hypothetical protein
MSYVDLKHLLADLTLEAVQQPTEARWPPMVAAYAELSQDAPQRRVRRDDVLRRAAALTWPAAPVPSDAEVDALISRGLLVAEDDGQLALPPPLRPHAPYLTRQAPRLLTALADLRRPSATAAPSEIRIGAALFNAGLFFECHKWFEGLWKSTRGPEKGLYQGVVQAAAAFYHFEKGNAHGCATLMRKARARLAHYPSHASGLDLGRFGADLARWDAHFGGAVRPQAFPRLEPLSLAGRSGKE